MKALLTLMLGMVLAACATTTPAPVSDDGRDFYRTVVMADGINHLVRCDAGGSCSVVL